MFDRSITDTFKDLTVLVAEDNAHMRNLLRTLLEAMGVSRVTLASDGATALAEFDLVQPDIVITDGTMKPMDGFQLIRELRQRQSADTPPIPIIMLSGYLEVSRVKRAKELGVTSFLAKPVSGLALSQHLRHAVSVRMGGADQGPMKVSFENQLMPDLAANDQWKL